MPARYFWIRDVDPQTYMRVLKLARARRKSVPETARELLYRYLGMHHPSPANKFRIAAARKRSST
jgi:hypothetical protein